MEYYTHILSFSCLGDKCPDDCCTGWASPISSKDYSGLQRNLSAKELKYHVKKTANGMCFSQKNGRCSALTETGLCSIHSRFGHQGLTQTCASFPRAAHKVGSDQIEVGGLLSCPEIARLTLVLDQSLDLRDGPEKTNLNLSNDFNPERYYHQMIMDVRKVFCSWLNALPFAEAVVEIASVGGLSPAFFNQASEAGAWENCLERASNSSFAVEVKSQIEIFENLMVQSKQWSARLKSYVHPSKRINKALEWTSAEQVLSRIKDWETNWPEGTTALKRYWEHYMRVYSYTNYPDLATYVLRLSLSTALLRWLSAAHQVHSLEGMSEMLYSVERLVEHSSWKLDGVQDFQKLNLPTRDLILGLVL